jgi:phosphatidylglycerol:prolipoprotein diacylglycerol transferase
MEFFREPDEQIGFIFGQVTLGQLLSIPFLLVGGYVLIKSLRKKN